MLKKIIIPVFLISTCFFACKSPATNNTSTDSSVNVVAPISKSPKTVNADINQIRTLLREMLKWGDGRPNIHLLPLTIKDSICTGFDMSKVNETTQKLKTTGFFSNEFIDNYKHIIQTLDTKIKSKAYGNWNGEEIPPFAFDSDASPWCSCQDNMSWDNVDVKVIKLDSKKGELEWNWGKLDANTDKSWNEFSVPFRVVKEDSKWKISYLWGFDYKDSTK